MKIEKNSKLYKILGEEKIEVNSKHRKCIKETRLDYVAYSEDGIIEALEDKTKKFFIGVQWHPESLLSDKYSSRLFDAFVESLFI